MKLKTSIRCLLYLSMVFYISNATSQNLLNTSTWTEGSGLVTGFTQYGTTSENSREYHSGPVNTRSPLVWKATPITNNYANGGWTTGYHTIDNKETYRFSVWIKKTGSNGGSSYLGSYSNTILNLNGDVITNPYFWYGDLPQLNKWYLVVGYVHGSNYNSNENYGGLYDGTTGDKIRSITDFKFSDDATWARHRSYLVNTPNVADRQYFYAPRMEQVNGEEPEIEELLRLNDYDCNIVYGSSWPAGSEILTDFPINGAVSENSRELGKNHIGEDVVLWKASPESDSSSDGGWESTPYRINKNKTHRFSVWIKKTNSNDGTTYFGCRSIGHIEKLNGTLQNNPYFWAGDLPKLNRWYLLVGYVHPPSYNSTASLGKIYDGVTGEVVRSITDYKFRSTANKVKHRAYLYYDRNTEDRQYFYEPRIDELSGCEPTITELLKINEDSSLIFSFDTAGNQTQRFYCSDPEYCSPIAARKKEIEEYTSEEELTNEEESEAEVAEQLKIYPNPTSGNATIQIQEELLSDIQFIKIYTANSVLVKDLELEDAKNKLDVDLSEQPVGLYFVHIHLKDGNSITKKIFST